MYIYFIERGVSINIKTDSRKVQKGDTFIAIKGYTVDGHDYIENAINNGASYVIAEKNIKGVNKVVNDSVKYLQDYLVNNYSDIVNKIDIIGITGTNGKTTSAFLIYQMLNKFKIKTSYIGTIGFYLNDEVTKLNNTTPDILSIYEMILKSIENGCKVVVMEVSSHALSLGRIKGLKLKYAGFTNLTIDHLDFHKTIENYLKSKLLILDYLNKDGKIHVNIDDEYGKYFIFPKSVTYGFNKSYYQIISFIEKNRHSYLTLKINNKKYRFKTVLKADFNAYNLALAISIVSNYVSIKKIKNITFYLKPVKGRCDIVNFKKNKIIIDYAHTPDATQKILTTFQNKKGKLITVIGCGGNRDKTKRSIMGYIATTLSDYVIFTDDNPRCENANDIINDIISGVKKSNYKVIHNRKDAIIKAINMLFKNDTVLILGKGHENYQIIGHEKIYFDDKKIVLDYLKKLN